MERASWRGRHRCRRVVVAACALFCAGAVTAGDGAAELSVLVDAARADFDGDGQVTVAESTLMELMLQTLDAENPVWMRIVLAYGNAMDGARSSPVDLSFLLDTSVGVASGGGAAPLRSGCPCKTFTRGDANGDGLVNIGDAMYVLGYLSGGPPPDPMDAGDANDSGAIDIADAQYLLSYLFASGPKPPLPFGPADPQDLFKGLDPTPDEIIGNACDLRVENFAEFAPAVAHVDLSNNGQKDAVWVTPDGLIWYEEEGSYESVVFADDFSDTGKTVFAVAVSQRGVVYAITGGNPGSVYALWDTNSDGVADAREEFELDYRILDAVLVDVSLPGTDSDIQALVALHQVNGHEAFTICLPNENNDYIIDGTDTLFIQGDQLTDVEGIAVDGRTGRIFVSGLYEISQNVWVPAVVFYHDTHCGQSPPGGDKLIDAGSGTLYYHEDPQAQNPDVEFPAIHYLAHEQTLYILALKNGYEASLVCVRDVDDNVWTYQYVCRSDLKEWESVPTNNPPKYLNVFAFEKDQTKVVEASVTMADGWTVWEYLAAPSGNCSCWDEVEPAVFTVPDAAVAAMGMPVCYAYVIQIGGDWRGILPVDEQWQMTSTWGSGNGSNRQLTAYYNEGTCGSKDEVSWTHPMDGLPGDKGLAVYRWFNATNPNQTADELWAETHTRWGVWTDECDKPYPVPTHRDVEWTLTGEVRLVEIGDVNPFAFDIFELRQKAWGNNCVIPLYYEGQQSGQDVNYWTQDPRQGSYSTTYAHHDALIPSAIIEPTFGPGEPFDVDVRFKVDIKRTGGGAGKYERGTVKLANGQESWWALWTFFRIRCR